ncbi:IS66 family transposase [Exilibacterium tricleocarpae]|uniref:IS66 family transposase n=1 Tax=Exilibacterium tricleocarpae TaxID=2591008 RepID=UPI003CCC8264
MPIEAQAKHLTAEQRLQVRQEESVPLWQTFKAWPEKTQAEGVAHSGTRNAISYMLGNWAALVRYCEDGRLPISNILSEHVAKTIALARKNFLFADTPAGAKSSAMIYSLLETAKANHQNPYHYLTLLLNELPNARSAGAIEKLLPWNKTPAQVRQRFDRYPRPCPAYLWLGG